MVFPVFLVSFSQYSPDLSIIAGDNFFETEELVVEISGNLKSIYQSSLQKDDLLLS